MTENQMMGAVAGDGPAKPLLEATKPFKVVKDARRDETVWAHTYAIIDGCLQFIIMKTKDVPVQGEGGKPHTHTAIFQTYPKTFAPGQWTEVEEIFVPPMNAGAVAN